MSLWWPRKIPKGVPKKFSSRKSVINKNWNGQLFPIRYRHLTKRTCKSYQRCIKFGMHASWVVLTDPKGDLPKIVCKEGTIYIIQNRWLSTFAFGNWFKRQLNNIIKTLKLVHTLGWPWKMSEGAPKEISNRKWIINKNQNDHLFPARYELIRQKNDPRNSDTIKYACFLYGIKISQKACSKKSFTGMELFTDFGMPKKNFFFFWQWILKTLK